MSLTKMLREVGLKWREAMRSPTARQDLHSWLATGVPIDLDGGGFFTSLFIREKMLAQFPDLAVPMGGGAWIGDVMKWTTQGSPVFDLSHGLVSKFLLTDVSEVRWDDLNVPFEHFAVLLPPGFGLEYDTQRDLGDPCRVEARVLWVSKREICSLPVEADPLDPKGLSPLQSALIALGENRVRYSPQVFPMKEALYMRVMPDLIRYADADTLGRVTSWPPEDPTVAPFVHRRRKQSAVPEKALPFKSQELSPEGERVVNLCAQILVSLCLYLDRSGTCLPRTKRDADILRAKKTGKSAHFVVGRDVKVSPKIREEAERVARGGSVVRSRWELEVGHLVRGYWRMQACGKGRRDRVRIFVEPYWRGPETPTERETTYKVHE
jgi:hypothetical protein